MSKIKKMVFSIPFLLLICVILSIISISIGVLDFSYKDLFNLDQNTMDILIKSRLPRTLAIILTASGLVLSGLIMQSITNNKFVSPTTAGTMSWAQLGILVSIILFSESTILVKIIIAFIFALLGSLLFIQILNKIKVKNVIIIPLIGMMVGNIVEAITSYFGYQFDIMQNMQSWSRGSFALITQGRYELLFIGLPFVYLAYRLANYFTVVGMGKDISINLGIPYEKIVTIGLMIVSIITASIVVIIGNIPFVGLVIPNIVSIIKGDNIKESIVPTTLVGILFLLLCDILGRVIIFPYEISISTVASVIGSYLFIVLLIRQRKRLG